MVLQGRHHLILDCFLVSETVYFYQRAKQLAWYLLFMIYCLQIDKNMLGESRTAQSNRAVKGSLAL